MLNHLKGLASSKLLSSPSNHTVSKASLYAALAVASAIALFSAGIAFAQWRLAEKIVNLQQKMGQENAQRIAAAADMATHQVNAHRGTLNVLLSRDEAELQEGVALRSSNLCDYEELTDSVGKSPDLHDTAQALKLLTARYDELSAQVVELFRAGKKEEALGLRTQGLRPLFNSWQEAHGDFTKQLGRYTDKESTEFAQLTSTSKKWLAGLLLAPLVLIVTGVAAIGAILGLQRLSGKRGDAWER
jgi:hypothetical protein